MFEWENCNKVINWEILAANAQINRRFIVLKTNDTGGCLPMPPGYIHVYYHYFQTPSSLKPHGQSKPNFMWGLVVKREHRFCRNGLGNTTKIAAMPIYCQNRYKSSSEPKFR